MLRKTPIKLSTSDKWRHSSYVSQLYNQYVRDSKEHLAKFREGASESKRFRHKLEFYSHLCGKVVQHLEKQARSPYLQSAECAKWNYTGLFFTVLYNIKNTHQKDIIVLLVGIVRLLREEHYGLYKLDVLRDCIECFLACLIKCSDRVIDHVQTLSETVEPTMNKWKIFADFLRNIPRENHIVHLEQEQSQLSSTIRFPSDGTLNHSSPCNGFGLQESNLLTPNEYMVGFYSDDSSEFLAHHPLDTLFANIIFRLKKRKDFSRLAFVLHWLHTIGLFKECIHIFYSILLKRMLELETNSRSDPYPRDLISVLRYSLSMDITDNLRNELYSCIITYNRRCILRLNLQDLNELLDCLLSMDSVDEGLMLAIFANLQLIINNHWTTLSPQIPKLFQSYLTERSQIVCDDHTKRVMLIFDYNTLFKLADRILGNCSLMWFVQHYGYKSDVALGSTNLETHSQALRCLPDIITKLKRLTQSLDETKQYCIDLIEHMSTKRLGRGQITVVNTRTQIS
ncbi:uncharacterized protein BBOV_IV004020 [Babesia bovis T2Bo]|uniref:Uncharacterized protein n=1 Tax=Babesia bovis TaxID=5865 RepID=A7AQE4_BABBO|nr:uncharacterized protein BBOV_IV004020 [Babesia bovis T2Bo]EDO06763.1 hypothetical protein BBOV_IV004020 [Babesia bovis T2Bo]|eukprot:XP_001610331.1 hypothetical protein [Babesia bovis T2Bo]